MMYPFAPVAAVQSSLTCVSDSAVAVNAPYAEGSVESV
jgi:hypothetical protein